MNTAERLQLIHKTGKTVFTAKFLQKLWNMQSPAFSIAVKRMVDKGLLVRLTKGIYAFSDDFDINELANTLVTPSYVSYNTALAFHDISFQVSSTIMSAAPFAYQKKIRGYDLVYYRMSKKLLYNTNGINNAKTGVALASPERAIVDCFYNHLLPNIDNLDKIHTSSLSALGEHYPISVQKKIQRFISRL